MEIKMIKVDDLKPYENNPRFNDEAVEYVAKSIKEFGFKVPMVVDKDNVIVAGHTRYKAAMELGLEEVPCIIADDLNEEQIKAFRLVDNKVSEKASWNDDLLGEELEGLLNLDMEQFGFDDILEDIEEELEDEEVDKIENGEIPFTEFVDEESQYVVLKFNNEKDWNYAQTIFGLDKVMNFSTRKDGKMNGVSQPGLGRVIDGIQGINRIKENSEVLK